MLKLRLKWKQAKRIRWTVSLPQAHRTFYTETVGYSVQFITTSFVNSFTKYVDPRGVYKRKEEKKEKYNEY